MTMIDVSNAKWDFSKEEKFVIEWFDNHGFNGKILKQYVSKTIFQVEKDDITDKFELPQGIVFKDISAYMDQFSKNWDMLYELYKLRKLNGDNNE